MAGPDAHQCTRRRPRRGAVAAAWIAVAVPIAGAGAGIDCDLDGIDDFLQTYTWQTGFGAWGNPINWFSFTGDAPGAGDLAVFDGSLGLGIPPYGVVLNTDRAVKGLNFLNAEGSFTLNGNTLTVGGTLPQCRELLVGGADGATLRLLGGTVQAALIRIGDHPGGTGQTTVDGSLGAATLRHLPFGPMIVGDAGEGRLGLLSGTLMHDGLLILGQSAGSVGEIEAIGASAFVLGMLQPADLVVGARGRGLLLASGGTQYVVDAPASIVLGAFPGGAGELTLEGLLIPQVIPLRSIDVGLGGDGLIRVSQGTQLETPVLLHAAIGMLDDARGEARVGAGSTWKILDQALRIAPRGAGRVALGETGTIEAPQGILAHVDGIISGSGALLAPVRLVGGELAPDDRDQVTPGRPQLHLSGPVEFSGTNPDTGWFETGRLSFILDTPDPSQTMSAAVSGAALLDGTLRVFVEPSAEPIPGAWYPVVEAELLDGAFRGVQTAVLPGGRSARAVYPGDGTARISFDPGAPGPATLGAPIVYTIEGDLVDGKAADLDGDGLPDLVVIVDEGASSPGTILVMRNLGLDPWGAWLGFGAPVAYPSLAERPISVDLGDMDGDGRADIVVLHDGPVSDQIRIRRNDPGNPGDFTPIDPRTITVPGEPVDLVLADTGGDGLLDVVTVFRRVGSRGTGDGGILNSTNDGGNGFDGSDDDTGDDPGSVDTMGGVLSPTGFVVSSRQTHSAWVYGLTGSVRGVPEFPLFLAQIVPTGRSPRDLFTADLFGAGKDDIVLSDQRSGTISVLRAREPVPGQIVYDDAVSLLASDAGATANPGSIVALDLNGDGLRDLALVASDANDERGIWTIRNLGIDGETMRFSMPARLPGDATVGTTPRALIASDVDGDGREDLIALRALESGPTVSVHRAGPSACNGADLAPPFGVLDLGDLIAFVSAFTGGDLSADLAPPFGVLDLADVGAFVTLFLAGCP